MILATAINPYILSLVLLGHFSLLIFIAWVTSRNAGDQSFFVADRNAPWMLVTFGMIGTAISGVTFISVPGAVGAVSGKVNSEFSYLQLVLGNLFGYITVALVLLPIYYKVRLLSIYQYLQQRFGPRTYQSGAMLFLVSRVVGASFRLYLMALVLHTFVLSDFGIPFWVTAVMVPAMIWIYTFKGGTKTVLWTDTIQTVLFLSALVLTLLDISHLMGKPGIFSFVGEIWDSEYAKVFHWEGGWSDPNQFFKQFFAGFLTVIAMVGLDQDLMQKNLTCRSLSAARKNMFTFSVIIFFVNVLFLTLGAGLYLFAQSKGIDLPAKTDEVYPFLAFNYLSPMVAIVFMIGIVACSYSSADSALTSLTTSYCVDFLHFGDTPDSKQKKETRTRVHIAFTVLLAIVILIFHSINSDSIVNQIFKVAGYTYGPLLGIFTYGILTKASVFDRATPWICLLSPILTYWIDTQSPIWFAGFTLGFLNLALNALITLFLLFIANITMSRIHTVHGD